VLVSNCRILNTFAGQWDVVEKFRRGEDVYASLASGVYGYHVTKELYPMERQAGKILELQAGYGSGEDKIRHTLRQNKVVIDDRVSYRDGYRNAHRDVVKLWKTGGKMLTHLRDGVTVPWGCVTVHDHRIFHNASGLWLDFTSLEQVNVDGEWIWRHRVKNGWRKTYGARLIENCIQWLARMKISDAMVKISQLGLKIPLTCHDDVYILVLPRQENLFSEAVAIMKETIPWLPECPINCEFALLDAMDK
jgi:hypothetical protein